MATIPKPPGGVYIGRLNMTPQTPTFDDDTATSVDARGMAGGIFILPASISSTAVTFQVSPDDSTFTALYDKTNVQISITVAQSRAYPLPAELFGAPYFKIIAGSSETSKTVTVCLST